MESVLVNKASEITHCRNVAFLVLKPAVIIFVGLAVALIVFVLARVLRMQPVIEGS